MKPSREHSFRRPKPPAREVREIQRRFTEHHTERLVEWAERVKHRRVVEEDLVRRLYGDEPMAENVKNSLAILRRQDEAVRPLPVRHHEGPGPHIFKMHPGLNVLAPPYDLTLSVAHGTNAPSVQKSIATGIFGIVGTAKAGTNFAAVAGVVLFIVPSAASKTLSIRPYFQYDYSWSCESHGGPTAHTHGLLGADVTGHVGAAPRPFPGKAEHLWTGSSDAWDDGAGSDADVWRIPWSELVVSGCDYYTVQFTCHADGDSGSGPFGWYSINYVRFHCRVPFLVVEEF